MEDQQGKSDEYDMHICIILVYFRFIFVGFRWDIVADSVAIETGRL